MRSTIRYLATVFAAGGVATALVTALAMAPAAMAAPQCTSVGPNTTQCETNGSSQIVTSPPVINNYGGWPYWGGGGIVISLGGLGR